MQKKPISPQSAKGHSVKCRFCGQKNAVKRDYKNNDANCGRCKLPLSNEPHKKFVSICTRTTIFIPLTQKRWQR